METQITGDITPNGGALVFDVLDATGIAAEDLIILERTGANEETVRVQAVAGSNITAVVTLAHASGSFVTRPAAARHVATGFASIMNTAGEFVSGRFGPDQSGILQATATGVTLSILFKTATGSQPPCVGQLLVAG